ncbi:MAG: class I SAM-dependent methyltransferase [Candidatus Omnitrophica bacterium]|nr:class I SAM-dependent methyltransferase [Candidatus Omnitrophota bacterium]
MKKKLVSKKRVINQAVSFVLVQSFVLMDLLFAVGAPVQISKENVSTLSPRAQLQTENFQKYFDASLQHDITRLKNTSLDWPKMTDPQLRNAVNNLCRDTGKTWFELTKQDVPRGLYDLFKVRSKKEADGNNRDVVSFMLQSLDFGKRLWRNNEEEKQKAVKVMREKIIPFLLSHRFNDEDNEFVEISSKLSLDEQEKELIMTGDLYFTRFREAIFSHAMLKVLNVATAGIANTIGGNALEFGRIVEQATEGRIKAEQVVRAYYRRQIDSKLEEIYKYAPYLLKTFTRRAKAEQLRVILSYYENGGALSEIQEGGLTAEEEEEIIQEEKQRIREINKMHKFLLGKLPCPEFLTCVKDILSFAGWLREAEYLSARDKEFADKLEIFWPQGQVEYGEIQGKLQGIGTQAAIFHSEKIKIITEFLNTRLSRWQARKGREERDYLKLIKRSAGWFSVLGAHDLFPILFKEKQSIKVLDHDAFFSSGYAAGREKAKSGLLKCVPEVTDLVYPPYGMLAGKNPNQQLFSPADESWPIAESSFDAVTSCFNLHRASPREILNIFYQVNKVLKEKGYFVITVPFNKYLPEEGIRVLEGFGFTLQLEQIAAQVMKHQNNILTDEESEKIEAQAISIQKRKFYVLVFQKQKNADWKKIQSLEAKNQAALCFIDAPLIEEDKVSLTEIGKRRKNQFPGESTLNIDTVPVNSLSLRLLGGRIEKTPILAPEQLRFMLRALRKYQNVLLTHFMEEGQEDDFSHLEQIMTVCGELLSAQGDTLEKLELNIHHDIRRLFQRLEAIYPQFTESSNIRSLLDELGVFLELNEDFLADKDKALIKQARLIWGQDIISENYADAGKLQQMNYKIIGLHKKMQQIEKEFIDVLQKLSAGKTQVRDVHNQAFWPLVQAASGWRALLYAADRYTNKFPGKKIYFPQSTALEKMIIEKALNEKTNRLAKVECFTASENVKTRANTADFVCSVFDPVQEQKHFLLEQYLDNARMLLRQKGKFVVVLPKGKYLVRRCRELLMQYGFKINDEYITMEYNLIEADKGEKQGQRFLDLLKKHPTITSEQLLKMVKALHSYQNVLFAHLLDEGKNKEFATLENILAVYEKLNEQEDLIIDSIDFDVNNDIPFLYEILEDIYPSFKERPRFKALLFKLRAFAEQNSGFFSDEDKELIRQAENIWEEGVLQEAYADAKSMSRINAQMLGLENKIKQIETELIFVLNKWSGSQVASDNPRKRDFLRLIGETFVWQTLEAMFSGHKVNLPELSIYFSGLTPFEKTIFEKMLSNHPGAKTVVKSFSVETQAKDSADQADIICSVFENSLTALSMPNDKELLAARRLLKQKGKWIIVLPKIKETNARLREALIKNGFKINREFSKGAFSVIEVDKGGLLEQTRVQLRKINQSEQITEQEKVYLRNLWQQIFKKHGFEDKENLLILLREFISILPLEEHFKIMLEQLEQVYKKMTEKRFISLDELEKFLRHSNAANGWKFELDDQKDETGKLTMPGLLIREQHGLRAGLFLSLEEAAFGEKLHALREKIGDEEKFLKALNIVGTVKRLQVNLETLNKVLSADTKGLEKLHDFLMLKSNDERFLQILYAARDYMDEQGNAFSALERFSGKMDAQEKKFTKQMILIVAIVKDGKRFLDGLSAFKFSLRHDQRFIQALDLMKNGKTKEKISLDGPEELFQRIDSMDTAMSELTVFLEQVTKGKRIIRNTQELIPQVTSREEALKNFIPAVDKVNRIVLEGLSAAPEFQERCRYVIESLPEHMLAELACLPHITEIDQLFKQTQGKSIDVLDTRNALEEKLLMLMRAEETSYYWDQLEEYVNEEAPYLRFIMLSVMFDALKYEGLCGLDRAAQIEAKIKQVDGRLGNTVPQANLVLALRSLFMLNKWMEMETRNVNYKILIQKEINNIFEYLIIRFEKDTAAQEIFTSNLLLAKYAEEMFFWRGLINNDRDRDFFSKKVAETFYFNEPLFSLNFMRWLHSIAYSDKAGQGAYSRLLGTILGYFEQEFANHKKTTAWLGKKLQIAQRQIKVIFSKAQRELVEKGKQKPIAARSIRGMSYQELREIVYEIISAQKNIAEENTAFPVQVRENFLVRIEMLVFFVEKYKNIDLEKWGVPERMQLERLISKLLEIGGSLQEISMIAASEMGEVPIVTRKLAQLVVPDVKFARFLESIAEKRAFLAELIDNNEPARGAVLKMLSSDDYYEVSTALLVIRKYLMHKGTDTSKELLAAIWRIVFSKHGLKLDAMLRIKVTALLHVSLPQEIAEYNLAALETIFEQIKQNATTSEIEGFRIFLEKIFGLKDAKPKKAIIKRKETFKPFNHFEQSV